MGGFILVISIWFFLTWADPKNPEKERRGEEGGIAGIVSWTVVAVT